MIFFELPGRVFPPGQAVRFCDLVCDLLACSFAQVSFFLKRVEKKMRKSDITLIGAFSAFLALTCCFISARFAASAAFCTRLACFISFFWRQASIFWLQSVVPFSLLMDSSHSCSNRAARSSSDSVRSRFRARLKLLIRFF